MTQMQTPRFGEARVAPIHLSVASVVSTDVFSSMASIVIANSVWQSQEPIVDKDWLDFSTLAAAWKRETSLSSSVRRKYASEHYKKIIGMGPKAAFLIVRQIELEGSVPYHWWDALRELTGHDPVPPEVGGDIRATAKIWIEWARQQDAGKLGAE